MTKTKPPQRKASLRILISCENAMIPRFSFHKMFGRRATHVGRRRPRRLPGCGKVVASEWRIVSGHDSVCAGWGASNDAGSHGGTRLWPEASLIRGDYDDGRRGTTSQWSSSVVWIGIKGTDYVSLRLFFQKWCRREDYVSLRLFQM